MLDTKVKVFHEMTLKLYFMKWSERKISVYPSLKRLPAKVIEYQNCKTFDQNEFLQNLDQELIKSNS